MPAPAINENDGHNGKKENEKSGYPEAKNAASNKLTTAWWNINEAYSQEISTLNNRMKSQILAAK
jgi:hypothetical protein